MVLKWCLVGTGGAQVVPAKPSVGPIDRFDHSAVTAAPLSAVPHSLIEFALRSTSKWSQLQQDGRTLKPRRAEPVTYPSAGALPSAVVVRHSEYSEYPM